MQNRARSLAEMGAIMGKMLPAAEVADSIGAYRPRPTDIIISPFSKCGTTWLQQAFHCLRTGGDTEFEEISCVVPWIETALALGIDLEAPQRGEPRGFKSHLPYDQVPKGARYVVSFRDPSDALVSMYRFFEGWIVEPGAVSIDEFARAWLTDLPSGLNFWRHFLSWWNQRENPNVLLLTYEHMSADPATSIRALARFCGIALDDRLLSLTLERSSLAYMQRHKHQFDDVLMRHLSERRCGIPPGGDSAKVRKGGVGGHRAELSADLIEACQGAWRTHAAPITGFADYASLEAALRKRLEI